MLLLARDECILADAHLSGMSQYRLEPRSINAQDVAAKQKL
jgi:hypothetical protein